MLQNFITNLFGSQLAITGNPAIDIAITTFVLTYIISQLKIWFTIIKAYTLDYIESKLYIVTTVKSPVVIKWILHALKKQANVHNTYHVDFDNFAVNSNKYIINNVLKDNKLSIMTFENTYVKIVDEQNQLVLKIFSYHNNKLTTDALITEFIDRFINHCRVITEKSKNNKNTINKRIDLFQWENNSWKFKSNIPQRKPETVIGSSCKKIIEDVGKFTDDYDFYCNFDIPYKRGYLLYGPPGTGKTSIIRAVASSYNKAIYRLSLSDQDMDDKSLQNAFSTIPSNSVLIIEDIDTAFSSDVTKEKITYSNLLNVLDGIDSAYGNLIFITTNHIEKLQDSMIRPGRIDVVEYVGYADKHQIIEFYLHFFSHELNELATKFADNITHEYDNITTAELQNYFIHCKDPVKASDNLEFFRKEITLNNTGIFNRIKKKNANVTLPPSNGLFMNLSPPVLPTKMVQMPSDLGLSMGPNSGPFDVTPEMLSSFNKSFMMAANMQMSPDMTMNIPHNEPLQITPFMSSTIISSRPSDMTIKK
jgi:hypothetical protein